MRRQVPTGFNSKVSLPRYLPVIAANMRGRKSTIPGVKFAYSGRGRTAHVTSHFPLHQKTLLGFFERHALSNGGEQYHTVKPRLNLGGGIYVYYMIYTCKYVI